MNNKKGGFGAKLLLVLVLMIASAVGGAYGYRVLDGKLASRDALKAVENVDISDYDAPEQSEIQGFIDDARKNLETAKTRKEVYDVITDFIADVDKVQTMNEKKLEEALRAAEEAKNQYNSSNNQNQNQLFNPGSSSDTTENDTSYDNNDTDSGTDAAEEEKDDGGFLGSLIGGMSNGSNGN
ncbi:MAG: hypothetical protein IJG48_02260 [Mogibacterium sp.]|nr:hypothetical protein [Mogibacterium sp.]